MLTLQKLLATTVALGFISTSLSASTFNENKKACDGGDASGCENLGLDYVKGRGVKQNYFKAAKLFAKACDGGNAEGCSNLGVSYTNGTGVKQSYTKAKMYFGKACDGGNADGCRNYAILNK